MQLALRVIKSKEYYSGKNTDTAPVLGTEWPKNNKKKYKNYLTLINILIYKTINFLIFKKDIKFKK